MINLKKRVLLIDPWGTANTSEYLNGLIYGLSPLTELTVFTNHYFDLKVSSNAKIYKVFFGKTEHMQYNIVRKILRGIEYYEGYKKIFDYIRTQKRFDVIHINWLLKYDLDILFLKKLKKYTKKLVYTAHNVIPHRNGQIYVKKLHSIYNICDKIVLHGESIKKEFMQFFPEFSEKIYVQKHGSNLLPQISYNEKLVSEDIKNIVYKFKKINIFFGIIFYEKGIDRIVSAWDPNWKDSLLVIAGRHDGAYPELEYLRDKLKSIENILEVEGYVDDNTLNFLIDKSKIILLPYRHASMSGVIFTAADFSKTVMCTDVGALKEYLIDTEDSLIVRNDDAEITKMLKYINTEMSITELDIMGRKLKENITRTCSWDVVVKELVEKCY